MFNFQTELGIIPRVNQPEHKECSFLAPSEQYLAVDECYISRYGYICESQGKIYLYVNDCSKSYGLGIGLRVAIMAEGHYGRPKVNT